MASDRRARPDSITHSTTTTPVNPSMLPGGILEEKQSKPIQEHRETNDYIRRVLNLHSDEPSDNLSIITSPFKGELRHPAIIDERACLLRNPDPTPRPDRHKRGDVQVIFYNYSVMQGWEEELEDEEDEEDEDDDFYDSLTPEERKKEIKKRNLRRWRKEEARKRMSLLLAANREGDKYEILPLQNLYQPQPETGGLMMEYEYFPSYVQELSGLKVIEFPACYYATEFLVAMQRHNSRNEFSIEPQDVLGSNNLQFNKQNPGFKTGVSLRATRNDSFKEYLTLLTAMPYFGKPPTKVFERLPSLDNRFSPESVASHLTEYRPLRGREWWRRESLTLPEYRFLGPCNQDMSIELKEKRPGDQDILVHQAWFMVFDNYTMGIFKSTDDQLDPQPPLYPYQEKIGAFHALVHAISNTLESSEKIVLDTYRAKISELEFGYQYLINGEDNEEEGSYGDDEGYGDEEDYEDDNKSHMGSHKGRINEEALALKDPKSLGRMVEKVIIQISTIKSAVQSQIQILTDLREIYRISIGLESRRPHGGTVQIPIMSDQKEQIRAAEKSLNAVINERGEFSKRLDVLFKDVKSLSQSLAGRGTEDAIERQANTMSMFTLVTTLFLPLGFFSSYATLDAAKYAFATQTAFWRICGPITAVFMLATFAIIVHKKGRSERFILKLVLLWVRIRKYFQVSKAKSRSEEPGDD